MGIAKGRAGSRLRGLVERHKPCDREIPVPSGATLSLAGSARTEFSDSWLSAMAGGLYAQEGQWVRRQKLALGADQQGQNNASKKLCCQSQYELSRWQDSIKQAKKAQTMGYS